ncbi:hypothetical protein A2737_01255 [Candidatus Nomurabacteria bacterium RIFCSPHIGHO2_01_FULL_41_71]|nr:MAG: hypothetical protein A2737_01255 [Candidatus Nomurabacteria bacterium RIFCSPHIGHO2_01_FULL_41_71]
MKVTYDKIADALYLHFQEGVFSRNNEVNEGVILDIGKGNKILGIEILDASRKVGKKNFEKIMIGKKLVGLPVFA